MEDKNTSAANPHYDIPGQQSDSCGIVANLGETTISLFDVNKMNSAVTQYLNFNSMVNNILGYSFKWFRAIPQQRSKDVIFQEYTLYNVEECPLDVKGIIPGGVIPDSKYTYDLMGLEYQIPFEIQIDKKYWESIAGYGTAPQEKDIVYWPFANKLYQVESSVVLRGFMEQETAWKINLKKYTPESSRKESDALKETIDKYTVSVNEIFGNNIKDDISKIVNDTQFSPFNSTSRDLYKKIDRTIKIVEQNLEIHGSIISKSYYDLSTPEWYDAITYNTKDSILDTEDRGLCAWINHKPNHNEIHSVQQISPITTFLDPSIMYDYDNQLFNEANYYVRLSSVSSIKNIKLGDTVNIYRPGELNLYAKIVAISVNPLTYYIAINPFVLEYMNNIKSNWNEMSAYKLTIKEPISVLDGVNDFGEHVFSVNVFANQFVSISYGHTYKDSLNSYSSYVIRLNEKLKENKWYGLAVNIGNTWKQYNVSVWEKDETDKVSKIRNLYYNTMPLNPESINVSQYTINKSPGYITNIKLFSSTLEEENQKIELLSYFSKDGDKIILSDLADPNLKLEYINKQR